MSVRVIGVLFAVIGMIAIAYAVTVFKNAETVMHEIAGLLFGILGATMLGASLLAEIVAEVQSFERGALNTADNARRESAAAAKVATERWDELCGLLERLEEELKRAKPHSNVGEGWGLPPVNGNEEKLTTVCAKCGKTVRAGSDWSGRSGKCPGCGAEIKFPAASV